MNRPEVIDALNQLLQVLHRSLPNYLEYAGTWNNLASEKVRDATRHVAADQRYLAKKVADAIQELDGRIDLGQYPLEFTTLQDLCPQYIAQQVVESLHRNMEIIRNCMNLLVIAPEYRALAEEALGNARGHIKTIEEVLSAFACY